MALLPEFSLDLDRAPPEPVLQTRQLAQAPPVARPKGNQLPLPWGDYFRRPLQVAAPETDTRIVRETAAAIATRLYTHFSTISATPDGHLHLFSFYGQQHQSGMESAIAYHSSSDRGAAWKAVNVLDGTGQGIEWRIGASGVTSRGRIILTALRMEIAAHYSTLGSIHSDDGGRTWSEFAELVQEPKSPYPPQGSQMGTFSQIKATPAGRLVMMGYIGPFNYALISDDEGGSWKRVTISTSRDPDYSEMAVQPVDENTWVAVTRVDRARTGMAQFVTHDSGATWSLLGPLNIPVLAGYVAPSLNLVQADGRATLVLGVTDRSTGRSMLRTADAVAAAASSQVWSGPRVFASDLHVRSGYQSAVADMACDRLVVSNHRETSEHDVTLEISMIPLAEVLPGHAARAVNASACPLVR